jgi:hypothetical protein
LVKTKSKTPKNKAVITETNTTTKEKMIDCLLVGQLT